MANARFNNQVANPRKSAGTPQPKGNAPMGPGTMKRSSWSGGLPGKAQPRDRSAGVRKAEIYPQSEGL